MRAYPPDFQSWPLERRNAWIADEAAAYRESRHNANGNGSATSTPHAEPLELPNCFEGFEGDRGRGFSGNTWPEPKPLSDGLLSVAAFNPAFLPEAIAPWVMDISDRMQCPPDFVGIPAIVALGSVIGRKVSIRPQGCYPAATQD